MTSFYRAAALHDEGYSAAQRTVPPAPYGYSRPAKVVKWRHVARTRGTDTALLSAVARLTATVLTRYRPGADRIEARDAFDEALDAELEKAEKTSTVIENYDYETEGLGGT